MITTAYFPHDAPTAREVLDYQHQLLRREQRYWQDLIFDKTVIPAIRRQNSDDRRSLMEESLVRSAAYSAHIEYLERFIVCSEANDQWGLQALGRYSDCLRRVPRGLDTPITCNGSETPAEVPRLKVCTRCGESKPANEDYFHYGPQYRDRLRPMCRPCFNIVSGDRVKAFRERQKNDAQARSLGSV